MTTKKDKVIEKAEKLAKELEIYKRTVKKELNTIAKDFTDLKTNSTSLNVEIKEIHTLLHNVSANGTRGLEASLRDIYGKINDLYELTKQIREDKDFKKSFTKWKNATTVRRIFFTKKSYVTIIALLFAAHKIQIAGNSILAILWSFFSN